jgi:hypothetical protein
MPLLRLISARHAETQHLDFYRRRLLSARNLRATTRCPYLTSNEDAWRPDENTLPYHVPLISSIRCTSGYARLVWTAEQDRNRGTDSELS